MELPLVLILLIPGMVRTGRSLTCNGDSITAGAGLGVGTYPVRNFGANSGSQFRSWNLESG